MFLGDELPEACEGVGETFYPAAYGELFGLHISVFA
jgi:hypothetical protein